MFAAPAGGPLASVVSGTKPGLFVNHVSRPFASHRARVSAEGSKDAQYPLQYAYPTPTETKSGNKLPPKSEKKPSSASGKYLDGISHGKNIIRRFVSGA